MDDHVAEILFKARGFKHCLEQDWPGTKVSIRDRKGKVYVTVDFPYETYLYGMEREWWGSARAAYKIMTTSHMLLWFTKFRETSGSLGHHEFNVTFRVNP